MIIISANIITQFSLLILTIQVLYSRSQHAFNHNNKGIAVLGATAGSADYGKTKLSITSC